MDYNNIDWLAQRFEKHADEFDIREIELKEKYPERDNTLDWAFNLPRALSSICKKIRDLENDTNTPKD